MPFRFFSKPEPDHRARAQAKQWWEQFEVSLKQAYRAFSAVTDMSVPADPFASDTALQAAFLRTRQLCGEAQNYIAQAVTCLPNLQHAWPDKQKGLSSLRQGLAELSDWVRVLEEMSSMTGPNAPDLDMRKARKLMQRNREYGISVAKHFEKGFAQLGRSVDLE